MVSVKGKSWGISARIYAAFSPIGLVFIAING